MEAGSSSEKVAVHQDVVTKAIEKSFEKKTSKKKSSEPSWVSAEIRKNIKRRRAVFKREGRGQNWWKIKLDSKRIFNARRNKYNAEKKNIIFAAGPNSFFTCINAFLGEGVQEPWDVATDTLPWHE